MFTTHFCVPFFAFAPSPLWVINLSYPSHQHVLPPPSRLLIRRINRHINRSREDCFPPVEYCDRRGWSSVVQLWWRRKEVSWSVQKYTCTFSCALLVVTPHHFFSHTLFVWAEYAHVNTWKFLGAGQRFDFACTRLCGTSDAWYTPCPFWVSRASTSKQFS